MVFGGVEVLQHYKGAGGLAGAVFVRPWFYTAFSGVGFRGIRLCFSCGNIVFSDDVASLFICFPTMTRGP